MAHKNMVNGTNYNTVGGRTMVNGTVYGIESGKVMVNGTVREIAFSPAMATVTILCKNEPTNNEGPSAFAEIGGNLYHDETANTTLEVPVGSKINLTICDEYQDQFGHIYEYSYTVPSYIKVNGTTIAQGNASYTYTVVGNVEISLGETQFLGYSWGLIDVTEK